MSTNPGLRLLGKAHGRLVHGRRIEVLAEWIAALIRPGWRLLDVGCGDGKLDTILRSRVNGLEVSGVEVQPRADCAIPCTAYDGVHLPFPANSFDACLFVDVLHHTTDPLAVIQDACRVSREFVIIKDHLSEDAFDHATLRFMDWVGNKPHGVMLPYNYLSSAGWRDLFSNAGLKQVSTQKDLPIYPPPFSMLFGRKLHFISLLKN
jgi:SAM-dependent methyltransferase